MKKSDFIDIYQPNFSKLIKNNFKNKSFFHAYLLTSSKGSSLAQYAKFLASAIILENDSIIDEECNDYKRINNETYGDLIVLDAKTGIKIEEIRDSLQKLFFNTASEIRGIKVYIILNADYLTKGASNSLLKFIEEPPLDTYAILTSENEEGVLKTIKSRTEIIHINKIDKERLLKEFDLNKYKEEDIRLLTFLYNDKEEISTLILNKEYLNIKNALINYLTNLEDINKTRFIVENEIIPLINDKFKMSLFYDLLLIFLEEALKIKLKEDTFLLNYDNILKILINNVKDLEDKIIFILKEENLIYMNINSSLLLLHSLTKLKEE